MSKKKKKPLKINNMNINNHADTLKQTHWLPDRERECQREREESVCARERGKSER